MGKLILQPVLELQIMQLPVVFDLQLLDSHARRLVDQFSVLTEATSILKHTTMTYAFRQALDEINTPVMMLVIGLVLRNQMILDFKFKNIDIATLEMMILEDRSRLISACKNLPIQSSVAAVDFSKRITSACLDLPQSEISAQVSRSLRALLDVKQRSWAGQINSQKWQHHLPHMPPFDWQSGHHNVRVRLSREKRGYSLQFLKKNELPVTLKSLARLPMPEQPSDLETASELHKAERTGQPIDIAIRIGTAIRTGEVVVADFLRFL